MTTRKSERSNGRQATSSYSVDYRDPEHPARTRITTAYEVIREAIAELPGVDQVLAFLELERRFHNASREALRKVSKEAQQNIKARKLFPLDDEEPNA